MSMSTVTILEAIGLIQTQNMVCTSSDSHYGWFGGVPSSPLNEGMLIVKHNNHHMLYACTVHFERYKTPCMDLCQNTMCMFNVMKMH